MKYNKTIQKIGKSFLKFFESFCSLKMFIFYHYCTDNARLFFFDYYFLYNFLIIYEYYINILFTIKHIAQNISHFHYSFTLENNLITMLTIYQGIN